MISDATINIEPAVIELDLGPASKRPLWVKSRHVQRTSRCPLYPRKRTFRHSFDHFIDARKQHRRHSQSYGFGALEVDDQLEFGGLFYR